MKWMTLALVLSLWLPTAVRGESGEAPDADAPPPCSDPGFRAFDFWIGEWDLTWGDGETGTNLVTLEYGGCVVQERFSAPGMGFHGMSVSVYEPMGDVWRQTWVDDSGSYLDFVGGFEDGKMRLSRSATAGGEPIEQRMTFYNISPDELDWDWEVSRDGGQTWDLRWQIHYVRKQ